ncbi:hypothetical protein [Fulvivirga ligni]|uniref:hypothetical protein n=1 Tax=Fulvivirga ligni TaxID=2904246 RepID=UPI001F22B2F3|nr:hypothetical protein [Fulvivirga ligni]UII20611.1 hypothetical protein LVD16_22475 [Fulvivirga ligni]
MSTKSKFALTILLYVIIGTISIWIKDIIPIEATNSAIYRAYALSVLCFTFLLMVLSADVIQNLRSLGRTLMITTFIFLILQTIGLVILSRSGIYEDEKVVYTDPHDPDHKIIEQRLAGIGSDHYRTAEIIELMPGFRYIVEIEQSTY